MASVTLEEGQRSAHHLRQHICLSTLTVVLFGTSFLGQPGIRDQDFLCSTVSVSRAVCRGGHSDHLEEVSTCSVRLLVPTPSLESTEACHPGGRTVSCAWLGSEYSLESVPEGSSCKLAPVISLDLDIFVF